MPGRHAREENRERRGWPWPVFGGVTGHSSIGGYYTVHGETVKIGARAKASGVFPQERLEHWGDFPKAAPGI